jgi:hypothetical protein
VIEKKKTAELAVIVLCWLWDEEPLLPLEWEQQRQELM